MVKFCRQCVLPDTRPGVTIDETGLCNACRYNELKKTIDWHEREKQFQKLCDKHRRNEKDYDCIIAVSSGKDSFWQVWLLKEKYHMNPLLVSVWNTDWTKTGLENFETMQSRFGCEAVNLHTNQEINRKFCRIAFEHDGFPAWLWDRYIYTYPMWMSIKFALPLVFYGENVPLEYGGFNAKDHPSALDQIKNDVVREYDWSLWTRQGINLYDIPYVKYPNQELIHESGLDPNYLSYYFKWSGFEHMKIAKEHGWKSLDDTGEWKRQGWIDDYNQIDDFAYIVDPWMKYPKYGHRQVTDSCCRLIRDGIITREMAIEAVKKHDPILDPISLEHFLKYSGYKEEEFWNIVEKFYNKELFIKKEGTWSLKNPIWIA